MIELRYTAPENILYLWNAFQGRDSALTSKIIKFLTNKAEYPNDQAEELITTALLDHIVIAKPAQTTIRPMKLKIPDLDEVKINENSYDWYCYECHKPSKDLQSCSECLRTFHKECLRIDPDKPNFDSIVPNRRYVEKPTVEDKNNTTISIGNNPQLNLTANATENVENEIIEIEADDENNSHEEDIAIETKAEIELDVKDVKLSEKEVIYVGQIRPPSRRRRDNRSRSFKAENAAASNNGNDNNEDNQEAENRTLCSCCRVRVMSKSTFRDPPNLSKDDISYLLKFVFDRVKSWISLDTFSPKSISSSWSMPSKKHLDIFSKLCFKFPKTLSTIDKKIKNKEYTTLTEFQCDFMDLQHCMGILYGSDAQEYLATKYLVSDVIYELSEIRQCPVCYRNSNEKKSNPYWFCKPCIPRHELVFAKQVGYSYWPAKVIRVTGNQYDVRFFGTNHSRAVVDATNVKPIDTDIGELKIKQIPTFLKAMNELRKHQELLNLSPGEQPTFLFESEIIAPLPIAACSSLTRSVGRPRKRNQRQQTLDVSLSPEPQKGSNKRKRKMSYNTNHLEMTSISASGVEYADENAGIGGHKRAKVPATLEKITNRSTRKTISGEMPSSSSSSPTAITKSVQNKTVTSATEQDTTGGPELSANNQQEPLVSSTQELMNDPLERLRLQALSTKSIKTAKKLALDMFKIGVDLQSRITRINEEHKRQISAVKRESWCCCCEKPAIYHCCWNTNYCSTDCQQKHWRSDHKSRCRRTR